MYAWNNKREENRICFAVVWFGPPLFPLLASKGKHVPALWERENERGSHCDCISCGGEGGRIQIRWQQERFGIFLYYICSWMSWILCAAEVAVYSTPVLEERGTDKWGRKLECWPWLASWPAQRKDRGPVGLIFTMMGPVKGNPCCLTWKELVSWEHLPIPAAGTHHIYRLWMTLVGAITLAFVLFSKTDHIEL